MLISDIETIAAYERDMPLSATAKDWIFYCCFAKLYSDYKANRITKAQAAEKKRDIINYLSTIEALALSNSKIIHELAVATAPRKDLVKKDKADLLDIISRIEGVATDVMKSFDSEIPIFLKIKEEGKQ